jgi:anthranilate/para-aminobenzoate synthase component II
VGSFQSKNWPTQNCIAMGDAAFLLLKNSGFDVQEILPLNGRLTVNRSRHGCPENIPPEFITVKYAQFQILNTLPPPGWTVWTEDENGIASTWIHADKKLACLLFRADSMMSDKGAQTVFQEALSFISQ